MLDFIEKYHGIIGMGLQTIICGISCGLIVKIYNDSFCETDNTISDNSDSEED